jgi:hypothetical protein
MGSKLWGDVWKPHDCGIIRPRAEGPSPSYVGLKRHLHFVSGNVIYYAAIFLWRAEGCELVGTWQGTPIGTWCVDVEVFRSGYLIAHKERAYKHAYDAFMFTSMCIYALDRIPGDVWGDESWHDGLGVT